jgi:3-deoxy-D-manno-octulosonic-acid transferase
VNLPFSLTLYRAATAAAQLAAPLVLHRRAARGKEEPARMAERLGRPQAARPPGRLAWLHGASVGEALSLLPLVEAFQHQRPNIALLVTSGTVASARVLAQRLPGAVIHQYLPIDGPGATKRFIDHWRPDLGVFAESEIWPNLILAAQTGGARLALVSAGAGRAGGRTPGRPGRGAGGDRRPQIRRKALARGRGPAGRPARRLGRPDPGARRQHPSGRG